MRVTAAVINWNGADHLVGCLEALLAQDHEGLEVLVVDNASTDGSDAILRDYEAREHRHPFRVLRNPENRGFAGAANDAVHASDTEAVLTCNPDVRPRVDYVRRVTEVLSSHPHCGAVQGKLLRTVRSPSDEPIIDTTGHLAFTTRLFRNRGEGETDRGQWEQPGEVFGISGALALYRRQMLLDVAIPRRPDGPFGGAARTGGVEVFDEDLFAFWEDVDLDWRGAMRGWSVRYEPTAVAEHERGGAGPRRTRRVEQLNFQNRLLTLVKCDSWRALVPALPGLVLTTLLKAAELAVTVPGAFLDVRGGLRLIAPMRAKRRQVHVRATVPTEQVVARWFRPFDYLGWVRTWWRRIRRVPLGTE